MFGSVRSPLSLDQDMYYVERTGAGYSTTSPGGTVKYQYFEPLPQQHKNLASTLNLGFANCENNVKWDRR